MTRTTTLTAGLKRFGSVSLDRQAVYLAALFGVVQVAALALAMHLTAGGGSAGMQAPGGVGSQTGAAGAAAGIGYAALEVVAASVMVALILGMRRLPDWLSDPLKKSAGLGVVFFAGAYAHAGGFWLTGLLCFVGAYLAVKALDGFGVWWLANNALAVTVAIGGAVMLGLAFSEWMLLAFLVGMTAYDYVFADRKGWMLAMAGTLIRYRLPVLFVKPDAYRFEWTELLEQEGADLETSQTAWGVGSADLMLPAAFTVAAVTAESVVWPTLVGAALTGGVLVAALRIRRKMLTAGSGAGLPPLTAAVAGAYALVIVPTLVYGVVV